MPAKPEESPFKAEDILSMLEGFKKKFEGKLNSDGWWNYLQPTERLNWEGDRYQAAFTGLFNKSTQNNRKLYEYTSSGLKFKISETEILTKALIKEKTEAFISEIKGLELNQLFEAKYFTNNNRHDLIFYSEDMVMAVAVNKTRDEKVIQIQMATFDESFVDKIKEICVKHLEHKSKKSDLFVVCDGEDGLELVSIGKPGIKLERDNYSEEVVKSFDYISKQLTTKEPFGRLVIVHGPAGTGKTRMLRSLIEEINLEKTKFIFFPPEFLFRYSSATITKLLVESTSDESSLILLLEDADECLVPRQSDNITAISTLLNFADGFIGNLLDIRIIATTNAKKLDIDSALKRPGRLCRIIKVDQLSIEHANRIFTKLTEKTGPFKAPATLAEVYSEVYNETGVAEVQDPEANDSVGFTKR
jgi:ATP-dependent 26S proteasome regulatory subunit